MFSRFWHLALVSALLAASVSMPARACSRIAPSLFDGVFFFEGQEIPRNAELRSASFVNDGIPVPLTKPDGTVVELEVGVDDLGQFLATDGLLDPGAYVVTIVAAPGEERRVTFTVSDEIDDDGPDAPEAVASHATTGTLFADGASCGVPWPTSVVTVSVTTREPIALVDFGGALEDRGERVAGVRQDDDTVEIVFGENGGDYQVAVRDFAGNESEPTTVTAGGCASSSSLPLAAILLGLVRRRRSPRPQ